VEEYKLEAQRQSEAAALERSSSKDLASAYERAVVDFSDEKEATEAIKSKLRAHEDALMEAEVRIHSGEQTCQKLRAEMQKGAEEHEVTLTLPCGPHNPQASASPLTAPDVVSGWQVAMDDVQQLKASLREVFATENTHTFLSAPALSPHNVTKTLLCGGQAGDLASDLDQKQAELAEACGCPGLYHHPSPSLDS
jgi:hypothetical protein